MEAREAAETAQGPEEAEGVVIPMEAVFVAPDAAQEAPDPETIAKAQGAGMEAALEGKDRVPPQGLTIPQLEAWHDGFDSVTQEDDQ